MLILDAPVKAPNHGSITFNDKNQFSIKPRSEFELNSIQNKKSAQLTVIGK